LRTLPLVFEIGYGEVLQRGVDPLARGDRIDDFTFYHTPADIRPAFLVNAMCGCLQPIQKRNVLFERWHGSYTVITFP
jgi:hypothetical protein